MSSNTNWSQSNYPYLAARISKVMSTFPPREDVIWLQARPFKRQARDIITMWARGRYPGSASRSATAMTPYDTQILERFATRAVTRDEVKELIISTLHSGIGDFTLFASGQLHLTIASAKYPTTIKMYGYYRGSEQPMVFRVKPSQQEKWERTTESWNKNAHNAYREAMDKVGRVYRLYQQVLDKCAEYQYAKTVD